MSKVIFDFVGGSDDKNRRVEDAMRKELAKLGTDSYRTPEQKQRDDDMDRELEDIAEQYGDDE
jgi:hypothetical protein